MANPFGAMFQQGRPAAPGMRPQFGQAAPAAAGAPAMARPMAPGYGGAAAGGLKPGMFAPGGMRPMPTPNDQKVPQPGSMGALFGGGRQPAPSRPGGFAGVFGGGRAPAQPQQQPSGGGFAGLVGRQQGQLPPRGMAGGMGALLSDEKSKTRIRELEGLRDRYEALLDVPTEKPDVRAPDTDALDRAYRGTSSNEYSYKDPNAPGAAPGRHVGPMAHELRSLPGVVEKGSDGMDRVNPDRLSLANAAELGETRRDLDALRARLGALTDDEDVLREAAGGR